MYSTVEDVKQASGIRYTDLKMSSESELDAFLTARLLEATDLINQHRNRDYEAEGIVPAGINRIALSMVVNFIQWTQTTKQTPIINLATAEANVGLSQMHDVIMTKSIRDALRLYPAKPRFRMFVHSKPEEDEEA